ncbi:ScbA/BarX family gamma-butyrolactone biosynthesis protein [Streptomyces sp. NPDC005408]|uniref:ScbA/BarX family gamma-butyrolactone biosynthesis protein n=1 Tax=Streptomyces sp. NPDC005408 TaxID=3155341 RepID=UPI0033AE0222
MFTPSPTVGHIRAEPVPMAYTRKTVPSEVFVTSWRQLTAASHTVTAEWPTSHSFYTPGPGLYDPSVLAETVRQALALLSHTAHDVPLNYRLGWEHFETSLAPAALRTRPEPASVTLTVTHTKSVRRRLGSVHLTAHITAICNGWPLGTVKVGYSAHPPAIYDRLRGAHANALEATAQALPLVAPLPQVLRGGVSHPEDVVLSDAGLSHGWQLRVDVANSSFFDHPHDHVPGMLLLEAASQAIHVLSGAPHTVAATLDIRFNRYVELDSPCLIEATPLVREDGGSVSTDVTGRQNGHEVFSARMTALEVACERGVLKM